MAGGGAEHGGDQRHSSRAARLGQEVGGRPRVRLPVGPESGPFQHHHERYPVSEGDFGDPIPLGVGRTADRPGQHGEILGGDHDRPPVNGARTDDNGVRRRLGAADQGAHLREGSGVEEMLDPGACVELARLAMSAEPLLSSHCPRGGPTLLEIVEHLRPTFGAVPFAHR